MDSSTGAGQMHLLVFKFRSPPSSTCDLGRERKDLDMSEHVLTYSDVKFDRSKKKKPGNKVIQKEMTAYSELKFQNLPEQQRSTRAQQTERRGPWGSPSPRRRNKDPSATPLQRQLATLVLGILCLILLIATGVLGYNVVQLGIERNSFHEQVGYLSSELTSCQNQGVPGSVQELPHDIGEKCPARWSHSTSRSYLFSPEKRPWDQCKYSCSSHSASLIMMESREDWDFIMTESFHYSEDRGSITYYFPFWTGLVYDSVRGKWFWEDGTTLSSGMIQLPDPRHASYSDDACAYVQGGTARTGRCKETRFCICEKMMEPKGKN